MIDTAESVKAELDSGAAEGRLGEPPTNWGPPNVILIRL